jgi:hypothetical protein
LVDAFSGEWTETVLGLNYINQQSKAAVPPKCTAKVQVTDIRYSAMGKQSLRKKKNTMRTLQILKARLEGAAAQHISKKRDLLVLLNAAHKTCCDDSKTHSVLATFRTGCVCFRFYELITSQNSFKAG